MTFSYEPDAASGQNGIIHIRAWLWPSSHKLFGLH
jgi:hypothetical protein